MINLKTRLLAAVLAIMVVGGTQTALAGKKKEKPAEQTATIVEQIKSTDLGLDDEYLAFLEKNDIKVVDGDIKVETVKQFKAIGKNFNKKLKKMGYVDIDVYNKMFIINFDYISDELKEELLAEGLISEEPINFPYTRLDGESENDDIMIEELSKSGKLNIYPMELISFSNETIQTCNDFKEICQKDAELCKKGLTNEHCDLLDEIVAYVNNDNLTMFKYKYSELSDGVSFAIYNYIGALIINSIISGAWYNESFDIMCEADGPIMQSMINWCDYYTKNYPTKSKTLVTE